MSATELFKRLGAPLKNSRWSWGSVRARDGAVFLRVWQDQARKVEGRTYMRVTDHGYHADSPNTLGYAERLGHVAQIKAGAPCYMVMCLAVNSAEIPREIKTLNTREVFVGGAAIDLEGDTWVELAERKPIGNVEGNGIAGRCEHCPAEPR